MLTCIFTDRRWRAGHHETCGALPGTEPYLRMTRFQGRGADLLGSTNPCPIAVHMEPFSTSVFKVLI